MKNGKAREMRFDLGVRARRLLILSLGLLGLSLGLMSPSGALAEDAPVTRTVGGHLGFALPILTIASSDTTVIGADFVNVGITPGITVHLDEHWSVDFEFIAFNKWKSGTSTTTFVVDPGVVYSFGSLAAGLRVA